MQVEQATAMAERLKLLTQTGPDTDMGRLLRKFWQPVAVSQDLQAGTARPLRVMGEDLTLYKDLSGTYGLVDRHCPHRRADTSYGFVEACGLRCNYHGWLFDQTGRCLEAPYEDAAAPQAQSIQNQCTRRRSRKCRARCRWRR